MLILAELLFSLPASNGKVERTFSQLKVIKSDKRTSLNYDTLDNLLTIVTSNCSIKDFNPDKTLNSSVERTSRLLNNALALACLQPTALIMPGGGWVLSVIIQGKVFIGMGPLQPNDRIPPFLQYNILTTLCPWFSCNMTLPSNTRILLEKSGYIRSLSTLVLYAAPSTYTVMTW